MDYNKAIEARKSIREFVGKDIAETQIDAIKNCFQDLSRMVPDIKTEYVLVNGADHQYLKGHIGYYGMSFEAPLYLLLLSEVRPGYIENAGYINEDMILRLTDMGLDSCWMTVNEEAELKEFLAIESDLKITAAAAVGYGKKERNMTRLHIKTMSDVEVSTREGHLAPKISLSQMTYSEVWGKAALLDEQHVDDGLRNALYAASYAPTFLNRQPFRLVMKGGQLILVRMMDSLTGEYDACLNCGAVMLNFAAALDQRRPFKTQWILGQPDRGCEVPVDCKVVGYCNL